MQEIKQEVITYMTKYKSDDGKKTFNTKEECLDYEARIKGIRKTCPRCNGKGTISLGWREVRDLWSLKRVQVEDTRTCSFCDGKGYLDKVEEWK